MLLAVRSSCTCVNKLLHVSHKIATVLKITQPRTSLGKAEDTEQCAGSSRGIWGLEIQLQSHSQSAVAVLCWAICCRGYTARKGLRISGVCLLKLQKTVTPLLFENRPWPALHSECCSWPFNVTSHLSQSSLWPVQPRLLFQIPPDTSCRVSLKCHSCICITSNLSEPTGGVFIFSISAFL